MKAKQRIKLFVILGIEFIAIAVMLLLIFFAGKQVHTVTFDLNGGVLLSGDLVQKVTQGHNATPPTAAKEGHYFLKWNGSYNRVTRDVTVEAVWEYETTAGIEYNIVENGNYCTIVGAFDGLQGDVYIGGYNDGKKVLAIEDGAFENCTGITRIHLLDGILTIGDNAFAGCTSLQSIELPNTAVSLGDNAFLGCESLESIVLPEKLQTLGKNAFAGCTSLTSVTISEGLKTIDSNAFAGCTALTEITLPSTLVNVAAGAFDNAAMTIYVCTYAEEGTAVLPETFAEGWNNGATVEWKYLTVETPEEDSTEE